MLNQVCLVSQSLPDGKTDLLKIFLDSAELRQVQRDILHSIVILLE